jgi:hypothetical protein
LTEFHYCPKCGEELVEEADFCHSCGFELAELQEANDSGSEEDILEDFRFIDETTMEDIDIHSPSDGENYEIMENKVDEQLEEHDITIDDLTAEQYFTYVLVDRIFERSTRIKLDKK